MATRDGGGGRVSRPGLARSDVEGHTMIALVEAAGDDATATELQSLYQQQQQQHYTGKEQQEESPAQASKKTGFGRGIRARFRGSLREDGDRDMFVPLSSAPPPSSGSTALAGSLEGDEESDEDSARGVDDNSFFSVWTDFFSAGEKDGRASVDGSDEDDGDDIDASAHSGGSSLDGGADRGLADTAESTGSSFYEDDEDATPATFYECISKLLEAIEEQAKADKDAKREAKKAAKAGKGDGSTDSKTQEEKSAKKWRHRRLVSTDLFKQLLPQTKNSSDKTKSSISTTSTEAQEPSPAPTKQQPQKNKRRRLNLKKHIGNLLKCMSATYDQLVSARTGQSQGGETKDVVIPSNLAAAEYHVKQFFVYHPDMQYRFGKAGYGQIWDVVWNMLEQFLYQKISALYRDDGDENANGGETEIRRDLTRGETASIVSWIHQFITSVELQEDIKVKRTKKLFRKADSTNENDLALYYARAWTVDRGRLLDHYLELCVRSELRDMAKNILEGDDIEKTTMLADGTLITDLPENFISVAKEQLGAARRVLPSECHELVLAAVNDEVGRFFGDVIGAGDVDLSGFHTSRFCAMINDIFRMSELLSVLNEKILKTQEYIDASEEVVSILATLAISLTYHLSNRIVRDLCATGDSILMSVGSSSWEPSTSVLEWGASAVASTVPFSSSSSPSPCSSPESIMERTVATFEDYFTDLEEWLANDYVYPKVVKSVFDATMQMYLESFTRNTSSRDVGKPEAVAQQLRRDHDTLANFFTGPSLEKHLGTGGLYSKDVIESRLAILRSLAQIVDPSVNINHAVDDVAAVLRQFRSGGNTGTPVILHLAGLGRHTKDTSRLLQVISEAKEIIEEEQENEAYHNFDLRDTNDTAGTGSGRKQIGYLYKVTDLRPSKQVRKIRLDRKALERMPTRRLKYVESSREVLEKGSEQQQPFAGDIFGFFSDLLPG